MFVLFKKTRKFGSLKNILERNFYKKDLNLEI